MSRGCHWMRSFAATLFLIAIALGGSIHQHELPQQTLCNLHQLDLDSLDLSTAIEMLQMLRDQLCHVDFSSWSQESDWSDDHEKALHGDCACHYNNNHRLQSLFNKKSTYNEGDSHAEMRGHDRILNGDHLQRSILETPNHVYGEVERDESKQTVDQRAELMKIYDATNGANWYDRYGWNTQEPICWWYGVTCQDGCDQETISKNTCPIVDLDLSDSNLDGTLPEFHLPTLVGLWLGGNNLSGSIPTLKLPVIQIYGLYYNYFTGTIPNFVQPELSALLLNGNLLTGTVPVLDLPQLSLIYLDQNLLTGTIPAEFPPLLEVLYISENKLSGTIPDLNFQKLIYLWLEGNMLSGTLPNFNSTSLTIINCGRNEISGTIPPYALPNLNAIYLDANRLTGPLPNLTSPTVTWLSMENNLLEGTIPAYRNPLLQVLLLNGNRLTGMIPEFASSVVYILGLQDNLLSGSLPQLATASLREISLRNNNLSGSIPASLWPLATHIDFGRNIFHGAIPAISAPNLLELSLDGNSLTGSLSMIDCPFLTSLSASKNQLTTVSLDLNMNYLKILEIASNRISGVIQQRKIPASVLYLDISSNQLDSIYTLSLPNLRTLIAYNNSITDELPALQESKLNYLDLSFNQLTRPLPPWTMATEIRHLILSPNEKLTGSLPSGMSQFYDLVELDIMQTQMHWGDSRSLPSTLKQSGQYQLQSASDDYQCPTLVNPNVVRSIIYVNPSYYDYEYCRCLPGTFGNRNRCITCPIECECVDGLSMVGCFASITNEGLQRVVVCPNPSACKVYVTVDEEENVTPVPQDIQSCTEGYEDRVCSKCSPGYGAQGRTCILCSEAVTYLSGILAPLALVSFAIYLYKWGSRKSGKLSILIFHMQTFSIIAAVISKSETLEKVVGVSLSLGSMQAPNLECLIGADSAIKPMVYSFARIPLLAILWCLALRWTQGRARERMTFVFLNLVRFVYYGVTLEVFGVFGCTLHDEDRGEWFLNRWAWVACSPSSDEYTAMLSLAIPMFFLFVCGLPAFTWWVLRDQFGSRATAVIPNSNDLSQSFEFLCSPYKQKYSHWELIVTARLVCFALVVQIVPYTNSSILFVLLLAIIQGSIWMMHICRPYNQEADNYMSLSSLYVLLFSYFLALMSNILERTGFVIALIISINGVAIAVFAWMTFGRSFITFVADATTSLIEIWNRKSIKDVENKGLEYTGLSLEAVSTKEED